MKKIISVLAVSALALGSVFADVSVEYTQKAYLTSNEGGVSKKLDLNGYNASIKGDLVFTVKNDFAGVSVDIDPTYGESSGTSISSIHKYYGWATAFDGKVKLQSGSWEGRTVNRMNSKAYKWEGTEYEMFKPGIINGTIGTDISRTDADAKGTKAFTTTLSFITDSLTLTGGIVTSEFYGSSTTSGTTTSDVKSGFVVDGAFKLTDTAKVSAIVKMTKDQNYAVGGFLDKKNFEIKDFSINFMTGVTVASVPTGTSTTTKGTTGNSIDAGFDFRAQSKITDNVTVTTMNNVSYLGTKAHAAGSYNGEYGVISVWDMLSVAAQVTDSMEVALTGEWYYADTKVDDNGYLSIIPSVRFAFEGADITSGLILRSYGWIDPTETSISVPFILHVKL